MFITKTIRSARTDRIFTFQYSFAYNPCFRFNIFHSNVWIALIVCHLTVKRTYFT